jgi:hypothetical protein
VKVMVKAVEEECWIFEERWVKDRQTAKGEAETNEDLQKQKTGINASIFLSRIYGELLIQ